jgi:carbamoyl-phosphate synthase large subunit
MKSVGEAMSIGRNFTEALQKALRSIERKEAVFDWASKPTDIDVANLLERMRIPHDGRLNLVQQALWAGASIDEVFGATKIDPWFLDQIVLLCEVARDLSDAPQLDAIVLENAKRHGFSDAQIASIRNLSEVQVRNLRHQLNVRPVYKTVDTCAAEFAARTPYHYSSYDNESEVMPRERPAVIILGSGPNRIGQGIEFDYSCVHASLTLREQGYDTIMINCNPETVSTDYDTSSRLYFEPLTLEDVLEVIHAETKAGPIVGVIASLGGQTPLGLAQGLKDAGVTILGTSPEAIHLAEERDAFGQVLQRAGLPAPRYGMASSYEEARVIAADLGYPVLVRPSYVLGGRGMEIVYDDSMLSDYLERAAKVNPEHPVMVDKFLDDAVEIDVDALYDGEDLYLGGVMEHIEEAGIHSGDSACALPPYNLSSASVSRIRESTRAIAEGVGVRGLINVQFAMAGDVLYVLEANPRASRTVPFVSKATGVQLAKAASRIAVGQSIAELRAAGVLRATGDGGDYPSGGPMSVKEAVLPFGRFHGVDIVLGPEMRSTGEVMGIDNDFGTAFAKSQLAAYRDGLPKHGTVFVSVADRDKDTMLQPILRLAELGFEILATAGTAEVLSRHGVNATVVRKQHEGVVEGGVPTTVEAIMNGDVDLVVNTPYGTGARKDGYEIRSAAVFTGTAAITTVQGLIAAVEGIQSLRSGPLKVKSIQEHVAALDALIANQS